MLRERGIDGAWAEATISEPLRVEEHEFGTRNFLRPVAAFGGRWLRVVVNVQENKKVIAFFDRRVSRESKGG